MRVWLLDCSLPMLTLLSVLQVGGQPLQTLTFDAHGGLSRSEQKTVVNSLKSRTKVNAEEGPHPCFDLGSSGRDSVP